MPNRFRIPQLLPSIVLPLLLLFPASALGENLPVPPDGFTLLFNGQNLSGWCGREQVDPAEFQGLKEAERANRQRKADASLREHWRVADGEIINDGHGVFCTTEEEFGDFELLLDWKMTDSGTDSGIYLRGCPQVQIWDPKNVQQHKHGADLGSGGLWNNNPESPGKDPLVVADRPVGEWNTLKIRLVGDRATVHLNGQLVVDNVVMHNFWDREKKLPNRGPIQLQTHGGEMRFRNIFIRRLNESASHDSGESKDLSSGCTRTIPGSKVEFEMVAIPAGTFHIGSPPDEVGRQDDEGPQVKVNVQPFWIGKYEVTWAEYHQFMKLCSIFDKFNEQGIRQVNDDNRVDAISAPSKLYDPGYTYETGDDPRQPAVSMSQYAAKQYTKWLSLLTGEFYRLPTEAEWEYACRAGTTTAFSFGDDPKLLTEYAWIYENAEDSYATSKVGRLKPNPWGLYDMHGNVSEWVLDQYDADHFAKFADYTVETNEFTNWPTKLYPRVLRGGSWYTEAAADCRSAIRVKSDDDEWRSNDPNVPQSPWWFASEEGQTVGFRIVRPTVPPPRSEQERYWESGLEQIQDHVDRRIDKEGRGERGVVDPQLPEAIKQLEAS